MKGSKERELSFDAAESKTLSMCGSSMRENRETPQTPTVDGGVGRSGKAESRNPDMHVCGESDVLVGPTKWANKVDEHLGRSGCALAAESAEERRTTKGNVAPPAGVRTQSRGTALTGLCGVRQVASRDRKASVSKRAADRQMNPR